MRYLSLPLLLALSSPAFAEDGLTVTGSVRLRYESIDGQARTGFNDSDDLLNLRSIVGAEYRRSGFRIGGELYDSRVYGDDPGTPVTTGEVNTFELVQAYVGYDIPDAFGKETRLGLQAGRFTLNLGSRRLIAADDYRNTTNGYTGLRADLGLGGATSATLIYTLPQIRLPDDRASIDASKVRFDRESFDLVLWGGLATKRFGDKRSAVELSFYHLGERDALRRPTRDRSLDTIGLRFYREPAPGRWDYESETIHQVGTISSSPTPTAASLDVSAWFAHLEVGYGFRHRWSPRLALEFDYASGDGRGSKFGRFDTLFGMRRGELAPAGLYNAVGRANLVSPVLRLEATPSKRLDGFVAYRPLWLASRFDSFSTTGVRDASGNSGRFAGHQVEARLRYWLIPKRLRLEWNGLLLAKGRFLREAPNAPRGGDTIYNSFNATVSF
ncbi:alginate export family protein [Sphingopyxis sp. Root1497]|uniref:alginate export family protein n=1 Tax=Sphingopyxis sp. Root1497 TaxID=1736474 RepID=UPI000AB53E9B|nr:alginate export family protein [Sphingopyxis sp. Root1497]